ncbi:hypothetical protein A4A49_43787, partial [Nicotiana attenuata]
EKVQTPRVAVEENGANEEENPTAEEAVAKVAKKKGEKVGRVTTIFKNNMKCCFTNEKENPTPEKAAAIIDLEMAERKGTLAERVMTSETERSDVEENSEKPASNVEKKKGKAADTSLEIESADEEENPEDLPTNFEKKKRKIGEKVQTPRIDAERKGANEEENPTVEETITKVEENKGEKVRRVTTIFKNNIKCCFTNEKEDPTPEKAPAIKDLEMA